VLISSNNPHPLDSKAIMLEATSELMIIRMPRRVDAITAPHLAQDLAVKIQPGHGIVLDFSQTQVIESNGVQVLLQGLKLAKQEGAQIALRSVQPKVKYVLGAAGVLDYFRQI
jgi:anti-anti-sigma factor